MMKGYSTLVSIFIAVSLLFVAAHTRALPVNAAESKLVTIKTPRGVKQSFILIRPEKPVASVILFAGSHGVLGLKSTRKMKWGTNNFLVRSRNLFAAQNLMVAVVDAPSDKQAKMNAKFRMSPAHAGDIAAVANYLKGQANVPVWLVGTSMGTFSAAGGAISSRGINGLILTSTVTRARSKWNIAKSHPHGVASMPLQKVAMPSLIVSHRKDGCVITPASDAGKLRSRLKRAPKVKVVVLKGGSKPRAGPCKSLSQHGFLGIEAQAVGAIAEFIRANSR